MPGEEYSQNPLKRESGGTPCHHPPVRKQRSASSSWVYAGGTGGPVAHAISATASTMHNTMHDTMDNTMRDAAVRRVGTLLP